MDDTLGHVFKFVHVLVKCTNDSQHKKGCGRNFIEKLIVASELGKRTTKPQSINARDLI